MTLTDWANISQCVCAGCAVVATFKYAWLVDIILAFCIWAKHMLLTFHFWGSRVTIDNGRVTWGCAWQVAKRILRD